MSSRKIIFGFIYAVFTIFIAGILVGMGIMDQISEIPKWSNHHMIYFASFAGVVGGINFLNFVHAICVDEIKKERSRRNEEG